jgi:hypothetical protein
MGLPLLLVLLPCCLLQQDMTLVLLLLLLLLLLQSLFLCPLQLSASLLLTRLHGPAPGRCWA